MSQKPVLGRKNELCQERRVENRRCIQGMDSHSGDPVVTVGGMARIASRDESEEKAGNNPDSGM